MEVWAHESIWQTALIIAMVIKYQTPRSARCYSDKVLLSASLSFSGATCSVGNLVTPLGI